MMRTLRYIAGLVWHAARPATCGYLGLALLTGLAPVAIAWLTKLAIDDLVAGSAQRLAGLAAMLLLCTVLAAGAPHWTDYLRANLSREVNARGVDRLFAAVERFGGLSRFEDPVFQDRLRLARQAPGMSGQLVDSLYQVTRGLLMVSGFAVSLTATNPWMTVAIALAAVPTVVAELRLSRRRADMLWRLGPAERREIFYAELLSGVQAAKEIRLFRIGGWLRARMLAERRFSDRARRQLDRRDAKTQSLLSISTAVVTGGGLAWGFTAVSSGSLTIGGLSMFIAAAAGVQSGLSTLISQYAGCHQQILLFGHYLEVVESPPDLPSGRLDVAPLAKGIELRDVWFRYSDEHPWVLRGVNLHIPHGSAVGLVGVNGAGKSTLVKLLCRFYDPTRGSILWDGTDIRELSLADLRSRIGVVFQDYVEYDLTARENIAIGDLDALDDEARLVGAAKLAGIHEKLQSLPQGYGTLLSRMFFGISEKAEPGAGVVLSGGQWQRLALARAFLRRDSDLMILDEPSAGLDAEAEHEIHQTITRYRAERTSAAPR